MRLQRRRDWRKIRCILDTSMKNPSTGRRIESDVPTKRMNANSSNSKTPIHLSISCAAFLLVQIVLTDALGLKCFDLLSNLHTEGCRDGPGVDLGAAADGAGGEGRCLAGRDHGS